jgi:hypothetical protein
MKTNNISVGVDLDGVVFDFEGEFCERFGYDNRHLFDLYKRYPEVDPELINEFIHNPATYADLAPIFGGILLVNHARRLGFNVVILTSRPKEVAEVTKGVLEHYDVKYNDLVYAYDKKSAIENYNTIYCRYPIKMLVDDRIVHLESLPTGVIGIAWEQPWNEGYYPRARYNPDNMKIEICDTVSNNWKEFWRNEK